MDCLSPILEIGIRLWDCSSNHVAYIHNFEKNLRKLQTEKEDLNRRRHDVRRMVEVAEQQPRMRRTEEVEEWLTSAETLENDVNVIIQEGYQELQNKCFGNCCIKNLNSTYKIGKRIIKKIDSVKEKLLKGEPFYSDSAIVLKLPRLRLLMPEWPLQNTVGVNSAVERVWKCIEDENIRIIRLCGVGGVGKTTLMKKVSNEFHSRSHDFDTVIWAKMSRHEDYIDKVQEVVRKKLDIPDGVWNQCSGEDEKGAQIFSVLNGKKFVLLLDDVWEHFDLLRLGIHLRNDQNQSKVIFTARSLGLYFDMEAQVTIAVECLPPEEALSLFRMTVGESILRSDPDLSELANTFARRCGGLPLALLTVAGAMACRKNLREWRHSFDLLHTNPSEIAGMGAYVFPLLKLSYDSLNDAVAQNCFLYCSIFPEDYNIRIDEIIDLWIGEGFLDGPNPCDQGAFIVGTLKLAYLLESDESKRCVRMHDIIRHMALWLARDQGKNKNKVLVAKSGRRADRELTNWEEAKWIPLFGSSRVNIEYSPSCHYLSTLIFRDGQLESFPSGFFDCMPSLKVLDLSGNQRLVELPPDIGNVKHLQYLNLSSTSIAKVPTGLGNSRKLRCLLLDYTMNLKWIPKEVISNLLMLQVYSRINQVTYFGFAEVVPYDEVGFLEVLECLNHISKIGITIFAAPSLEKILKSYVLRSCIRTLKLIECTKLVLPYFREDLSNLERLELFHCGSIREFKISERSELGNLSTVHIEVCPLLLNLNFLAHARNLEILSIVDCESLKEVTIEEKAFPRLKSISLTRLPNLKSICPSLRHFLSLLEIEVSKCPSLRQLPFCLQSVSFLQKIGGEAEWWDGLIWDDEAVKDACRLKFVSTPRLAKTSSFRNSSLKVKNHIVDNKMIIRMNMEESARKQIAEELKISASSQCPYVVVCLQSFYCDGVILLILEYMDGGSLAGFLKKVKSIPEPYLAAICKQVLKGLMYLHSEVHVIHRDIKPSNLLINHRGKVKINDFRMSTRLLSTSGRANTFVGTYCYMSPERIVGGSYDITADIWSLGLLLLECATGRYPYSPPEQAEGWTNFYELMEEIVEQPPPFAPSDQFSSEFCSFISACLQKDPKKRKLSHELLALPFLNMYDNFDVDLSAYFTNAGSPVANF